MIKKIRPGAVKHHRTATLAEQHCSKCRHFNGLQNKTCDKGIEYDSVRGKTVIGLIGVYPCFKTEGCVSTTCLYVDFPTKAEGEAYQKASDERFQKQLAMIVMINEDHEQTGKWDGTLAECSLCGTGKVRWSKAQCNGHVHAKCSTPKCFFIMQ